MLQWSAAHLHVREATGRNDGPEIWAWQALTGNARGVEWCGCYQAGGQKACGLPFPAGAGGARNWFLDPKRTYFLKGVRGSIDSLKPGHQVGFYYASHKRIAHIGRAIMPTRARGARGWYCNEGNTGKGGGRTGAGVHLLMRANWEIHAAANWLY